jgi:hypothetical protein
MKRSRRNHSPAFKTKVALQAIRGDKTLSELAQQRQVHATQIGYCKDANRHGNYSAQRFDFLGYTFRPRSSINREGKLFVSFASAVSDRAAKAMWQTMRRWKSHHRNDLALGDIAH